MKFKIRYADQIVGLLTIVAILALVFVVFMLGSAQRWFAKDYAFKTSFESAAGISEGGPVQYKGFKIGKIKTVALNKNNEVDVVFFIYDTYYDRVKEGSVIELIINPIGLGNQFLLHPGNGTALLVENSFIPRSDSPEGLTLIQNGLVTIPKKDDQITSILAQVSPLLTNLNDTLAQVNSAFNGTGEGPLAQTMDGAASTMTNVSGITKGVYDSLDTMLANVEKITADLQELSDAVKDPTGLIPTLIDPDGTMFDSIEGSLLAVQGTLENVEDSSSMIKTQVPQIARLIEDLRIALVNGQDVLEGLRNNPLLKNGISNRVQSDSSGTNSRDIEF